jgi:hypothetical protein
MALIVVGFALTLGARKLTEYGGRVLKLLSGVMMLALGVLLVVWPEVLHKVVGAVAVLAVAGGVTVLIVVVDRWRQRSQHAVRMNTAKGEPLRAARSVSSQGAVP